MTVLVTGAGGALGRDLLEAFAPHKVVGLSHDELDISVEADVWAAVTAHAPALVVNAAAATDVDACELDPHHAHRVNALGPWWLARACHALDATLVQVSTDYVFDGRVRTSGDGRPRGFTEFDAVDPINAYGRSKAAGETLVRQALPAHHIVRTSWLSGAHGTNFVRRILAVADGGGRVRVVDDQTGSPTFTRDLALAIREVASSGRYGTVHRTNFGSCTRYELAQAVFNITGRDVDLVPVPSSELDRPAPRPAWSVLSPMHATTLGLTPLPAWRDSLRELLRRIGATA